jgi:hypothetical protein
MKFRLIYIVLIGLLFTGSLSYFSKPAAPVSVSHTGVSSHQDPGLLGTLIPDLPVPQFIIDEEDTDSEELSSLLRKPVVSRVNQDTHLDYSCISDPLTLFHKEYQRSVFPVSDIYISHRSFRI